MKDEIDFKKLHCLEINKLFIKEGEKKPIKEFLNNKRERTNDCTIEDKSSIETDYVPKIEFKYPEINGLKNLKDDYIYVGCEDGNIKLVKINNERIFDIFFK